MINEIRIRLDSGEKIYLKCVDLNKFLTEELNCKTRYNKKCMAEFDSLVDEVSDAGVTMEDGFFIDEEELKYFKIKESKEKEMSYSEKLINKNAKFQEMLAAASFAVARGKLSSFIVNDMDCSDKIGNALYLGLNMTYHAIENEIKGIYEMIEEINIEEREIEEIKKVGFDDLIDAAVRAVKDDVIVIRRFHSSLLNFEKIGETKHASDVEVTIYSDIESIESAIDYINSLYTETFVIESMEDIDNIKWDTAKAALTNDCELDLNTLNGAVIRSAMLRLLKGATVTQQKGGK